MWIGVKKYYREVEQFDEDKKAREKSRSNIKETSAKRRELSLLKKRSRLLERKEPQRRKLTLLRWKLTCVK